MNDATDDDYDVNIDNNTDIPTDSSEEDDIQIREAADKLPMISGINPEIWNNIDSQGRLETLQNVENEMAEIQGRPSVPVILSEMNEGEYGGFDGEKIQINASTINNNDLPVSEFVDTIVHEGRHAYQYHAINNPGFIQDQTLVDSWADNLAPGNYIDPKIYGQELYANQPVESDAWNYAGRIITAIQNR